MDKENIELLKRIQSYLGSGATTVETVYITPAQRLRNEADRMEQQERDCYKFQLLIDWLEKQD